MRSPFETSDFDWERVQISAPTFLTRYDGGGAALDIIDGGWHLAKRSAARGLGARGFGLASGFDWMRTTMGVKSFFTRVFTWWNGETFGTQLWTWRFGELVGTDDLGNRYYRTIGGKIDPALGFERRWVIYNGYAEASMIGPDWHGWMHHTVDVPPTEDRVTPRPWWKPHQPNLTGTPGAYRPPGSTLAQGHRPPATGDYEPWSPGH